MTAGFLHIFPYLHGIVFVSFFYTIHPMNNATFSVGDVVVLISDDTIKYTIVLLYGHGNAICRYRNKNTDEFMEISIPTVALMKYKKGSARHVY